MHLQSGAAFSSDLTLWAIVAGIPDLAARSGLAVNEQGRVIVDEFLRSVTDNRIFAVGDCAAVPGARLACYTAQPQAMRAVDTLDRLVNGRAPKPYSMPYVARAVTLGRKDAVGQFTHGDDTPRRVYIAGRTAVAAKEMASRGGKFNARNGGF